VGINPSSNEFNGGKSLLPLSKKRLVDVQSLELHDTGTMTSEMVEQVWKGCISYFLPDKNPFWAWFKDLELVMRKTSASYRDGSACHIDLVQWATMPAWRGLSKSVQEEFLRADHDFFKEQVASKNIELLLLNGRQVYDQVLRTGLFQLEQVGEIRFTAAGKSSTSKLVKGYGPNGGLVLGWTLNIQNMHVSKSEKTRIVDELGDWIAAQNPTY
jgi:hypothetical protein